MFDVIERLKTQWTDRYVVVDSPAPELARFARATGLVKTVNMNGRCLVEFDQYNNVGWYDIDPACLRIVPKPEPKPAEAKDKGPKPAAKPAAKPVATAKPAAAAKPAAGARPSTADILAAARGKSPAPAAGATARPSTAEILARARAAKAEAAPPAETAPPAVEEAAAPAPAEEPAAALPKKKAGGAAATGPLPTTTAEKIAWCRAHDAKG